MNIGDLFNTIFAHPIANVLVAIYQVLSFLHIPYPLGFSIIILTAISRLILWPIAAKQIKSTAKMQQISHLVNNLKEKHKNDRKLQQQEMMKLYKEHGINPMAGCLPLLIQIPFIYGIFNVLHLAIGENVNTVVSNVNSVLYFQALHVNASQWNTHFFGLPLSAVPQKLFFEQPLYILIPILTGLFQIILSKMMMPSEILKAEEAIAKKTKTKTDDFQTAFQKQSLFIFPVMIGFFSFTFPLGISLFWNTQNIFAIIQQYILVGPGGAHHWFEKAKTIKNGKRR
jgi:YidC/Oxa1 family membrane protein insertase